MAPFADEEKYKINMKLDIRVRLKILLTGVDSNNGIKTHAASHHRERVQYKRFEAVRRFNLRGNASCPLSRGSQEPVSKT